MNPDNTRTSKTDRIKSGKRPDNTGRGAPVAPTTSKADRIKSGERTADTGRRTGRRR